MNLAPPRGVDEGMTATSTRRTGVLMLAAALWCAGAAPAGASAPELDEAERHIVEQTNRFRREQGAPPVRPNRQLAQAAHGFAQFMASSGEYGHQADGRQPVQRTRAAGYDECLVAENIAFQYSSAGFTTQELVEGFFEGWRNSAGHRRNMLDGDATETAVAIARSAQGRYYAVQLFGRPASQRVRFSIANRALQAVRYELDGKPFDLPPRATRTHEQCGQSALQLQWPGADPPLLHPAAGEQLRVEQANGRWRLARE